MKYLKMLSLAAVAAAALMAFAGAGTATADEICTTAANAENMCPAGKLIEKIEASLVGSAKLEDTSGNTLDTCTAGSVKITNITAANGNKTGSADVTGDSTTADITWGTAATPCSFATSTVVGGVVHASHAAGGGTTITATSIEVTINLGGFFGSCTYGVGAGLDLGTVAQGGNTLVINKVVNRTAGGFACPLTAVWNATYKVTNHTAVFYITN